MRARRAMQGGSLDAAGLSGSASARSALPIEPISPFGLLPGAPAVHCVPLAHLVADAFSSLRAVHLF